MLFIALNKIHRSYWWVLFFSVLPWFLAEFLNWVFAYYGKNTIIIFNLFDIISTVSLSVLYAYLADSKNLRKVIFLIVSVYCVFAIVMFSAIDGWFQPAPFVSIVTALIPILLSINYFYNLLNKLRTPSLFKDTMYWINSAILIYYGMSFFAYLSFAYIINDNLSDFNIIWAVLIISNIIHNILYTIGLWQLNRA